MVCESTYVQGAFNVEESRWTAEGQLDMFSIIKIENRTKMREDQPGHELAGITGSFWLQTGPASGGANKHR